MNDLRLPGLLGLVRPNGRSESVPARNPAATDTLSFERTLQRSTDARPNADDAPERSRGADRRDGRRDDTPAAAAEPRATDADAARPRSPQSSEGAAREGRRPDTAADAARDPRQAAAASRTSSTAGSTDASAASAGQDDDAGMSAASQQGAVEGAPAQATDGTDAFATPMIGNVSNVPLPDAATAAASAASTAAATAAAALRPSSFADEPHIDVTESEQTAYAALDSQAASPTTHSATKTNAPSATAADIDAQVTPGLATPPALDTGRLMARDRLLEDFERRFESSLARAAGAHAGSPLNPAGPLAAAGFLSQPGPASSSMTVAYAGVTTPIGHPAFGNDLAHRVLIFAGQRVQAAEISVTPGDLGPIKVSIDLRGQEAALQFTAAHATTRAAIEDALPRLREMFAAQGLQLTQANVSDQSQRDAGGSMAGQRHAGGDGRAERDTAARLDAVARVESGNVQAAVSRRIGLIDVRV